MKPDWKDAPEWANWLAMDADGKWFWHEYEPRLRQRDWDSFGAISLAGDTNSHWEEAISCRPETTKPAEAGSEGQGA
jgi:hypothetical protein